jgi:hypothetical protein
MMRRAQRIFQSGRPAGLAAILCLLCAGSLPLAAFGEEDREAPRVRARNPTVDLGVVSVGAKAEARFALENAGNGVLEIFDVEPGCDCTLAEFDEAIAPGQVGFVRAALDTTELLGPVTKGIVVNTNDPDRRQILLTLKAMVVGSVALLPQPVIYIRKRAGQSYVGRLLIRPEPGETGTLAISDVTPSAPYLTASAVQLSENRPRGDGLPDGRPGDWVLEVRFRDNEPVYGRLRDHVRFRTGLSRQPEVTVVVESKFDTPINLSSARLALAAVADGGAAGTLFASVRHGLDPTKLQVEAEPVGLEVAVRPATERMYEIEVRWPGGTLADATLTFRIDDDLVRVPVEWNGR